MTLEGWEFYRNDTRITLEEVIKALPTDLLFTNLNQAYSTSQQIPAPPQSQPTPSTPIAPQTNLTICPKVFKTWICPVCDYVYKGDIPPETCPWCGAPGVMYKEQNAEKKSSALSPKASTPPQSKPIPDTQKVYHYIHSIPRDKLIQSITNEYYRIKGSFHMAPAMGVYGSFEFAGVLLVWKYSRENVKTDLYNIGDLMIPLGAHIGCAFNCMFPEEWSNSLESIINTSLLLSHDEFGEIYAYLKENFSNEIHEMEFCNGDGSMDVNERMTKYRGFTTIYNALPDFSFALSYFERQGLRIKQDMPFRIDC